MTLFARHFFTLFVTFGEMLWFTFVDKFCQIGHNLRIFVAFWWNIVICAICHILVNVAIYAYFQEKNLGFQAPKTIMQPWLDVVFDQLSQYTIWSDSADGL